MKLTSFLKPAMMVYFFEAQLRQLLAAFAEQLDCNMEDITVLFRANKKQEIVARITRNKKKVEDVPLLPLFERVIRGVLSKIPDGLKDMAAEFEQDFGKDLEDAFANPKETNQAIAEQIDGDTLIVTMKDEHFVYALKKKEGGRPTQVHPANHLTKKNLDKLLASLAGTGSMGK